MADLMNKFISAETVAEHSSRESCWIIVHGKQEDSHGSDVYSHLLLGNVYDVTSFLDGKFGL